MAWLFDGGRGAPRDSVLTGVIAPAYWTPAYCAADCLCWRAPYALSELLKLSNAEDTRGGETSVVLYPPYKVSALWSVASRGSSIGLAWASETAAANNAPDSQYFARENPALTIIRLLNG